MVSAIAPASNERANPMTQAEQSYGLGDFIGSLGDVATSWFKSDADKAQAKAQAQANASAASNTTKYLIWGGVALVVVVGLFLVFRSKD